MGRIRVSPNEVQPFRVKWWILFEAWQSQARITLASVRWLSNCFGGFDEDVFFGTYRHDYGRCHYK